MCLYIQFMGCWELNPGPCALEARVLPMELHLSLNPRLSTSLCCLSNSETHDSHYWTLLLPRAPTTYTLEFQFSEDEWQEETTQRHGEDEDKGQGQRGGSGLHYPQHRQADDLDAREEVHAPGLHLWGSPGQCLLCSDTLPPPQLDSCRAEYPLDKGHIRVVLGRLEHEQDAVKELDATEGCDSHVQEDAE